MHVQYVALCDQVILSADGRPSLIGLVNDLQLPRFPFTLPRLSFAARLLFSAEESGRAFRIEVRITDPEGTELGRPGGEISLPPAPANAESVAVDLPLQLDFFELKSAGRYTFLLHVDDAPSAAVQLNVRESTVA